MNSIKGISHVGIPTDDFKKSVDQYEKLGFKLINQEDNAGSQVGFFQINDLMLEVYDSQKVSTSGAINHLAVETDDVEQALTEVKSSGFELIDPEVQHLPFWEHGISYFNFFGPNHEIIEVCQKNKS